jgi:hypothetical protein
MLVFNKYKKYNEKKRSLKMNQINYSASTNWKKETTNNYYVVQILRLIKSFWCFTKWFTSGQKAIPKLQLVKATDWIAYFVQLNTHVKVIAY